VGGWGGVAFGDEGLGEFVHGFSDLFLRIPEGAMARDEMVLHYFFLFSGLYMVADNIVLARFKTSLPKSPPAFGHA
jgi:hypothetical protein